MATPEKLRVASFSVQDCRRSIAAGAEPGAEGHGPAGAQVERRRAADHPNRTREQVPGRKDQGPRAEGRQFDRYGGGLPVPAEDRRRFDLAVHQVPPFRLEAGDPESALRADRPATRVGQEIDFRIGGMAVHHAEIRRGRGEAGVRSEPPVEHRRKFAFVRQEDPRRAGREEEPADQAAEFLLFGLGGGSARHDRRQAPVAISVPPPRAKASRARRVASGIRSTPGSTTTR